MSEFMENDNRLEDAVLELINKEYPLTQENIAKELNNELKNDLCHGNFGTNFPITENNHTILKEKKGEEINNLYRLKHFIENFCNKPSGETCDFNEIKNVVEGLPDEVGDIDREIDELMRKLTLEGGKKKKTMKGGDPELLKKALNIIHKVALGAVTLKNKTGEALQDALAVLDQTIVNIFKIADHVINNFDAFEALGCVRLFISTLIGEKLSKILESMLVGVIGIGSVAVTIQQAPQYVKYTPIILNYLAKGGATITSAIVCFYIGDYLSNLSTLGAAKYEKLSEEGKELINGLAEKVQNSQNGDVELATIQIENYNDALKQLVTDLKPADLEILTTIENEVSTDIAPTGEGVAVEEVEVAEDGEGVVVDAVDGEGVVVDAADGEEEVTATDGDEQVTATYGEEAVEEEAVEEEAAAAGLNRKRSNENDQGESNKIQKNNNNNNMDQKARGGKKKKKGRTTQKKKKGTKGKKKASKSKKAKTKKNRKTKKAKKSNKK